VVRRWPRWRIWSIWSVSKSSCNGFFPGKIPIESPHFLII
jgi:hypothetical protein